MKNIKSRLVKGRPFILRVPKFPTDNLLLPWAALLQWQALTQHSQLLFCEGQDLNSQLGLMSWSVPEERYQSYQGTIFLGSHFSCWQFWDFRCPWWFRKLVMPKRYLSLICCRPQREKKSQLKGGMSWWLCFSFNVSHFQLGFLLNKCHKSSKSTHLSFFPFSLVLLPFLGNIFSSFPVQY